MSNARTGRYVKPANRCTVPGVLFAVKCWPQVPARTPAPALMAQTWHTAEVAVTYRRRDKWRAPQVARVSTPDALREWMAERAMPGRTNWVVAPRASEALTLSEWWSYADHRGVSFRDEAARAEDGSSVAANERTVRIEQMVLGQRVDIITYRADGIRWRWVSECNYWPDGCADGGDAEGMGEQRAGDVLLAGQRQQVGCIHDAGALLSRFVRLCQWWQRVATAPLGLTAGQLAWGLLRSDSKRGGLCTHNDPDVHGLERGSAHGGRSSLFYVGCVVSEDAARDRVAVSKMAERHTLCAGRVTRLDVSSMYAHLLHTMEFPVKLRHVYRGISAADVLDLARSEGVIARVRADVRVAEYPMKTRTRTEYPLGRVTLTLTGPELLRLAQDGEIVRVEQAASYAMGRPFAATVGKLLGERADARRRGDLDAEALSKLVANSLGGKCAQRYGRWCRHPMGDCPRKWGEEFTLSHRTGRVSRFRWICGLCWRYDEEEEPRGPHTYAFAYLTAYGRLQMRQYRDACPARSVVSQHTDGLMVLPPAVRALAERGILGGEGPGTLRTEGSADSAEFWTPNHYRFGSEWTLAGFSQATWNAALSRVEYASRTPLWCQRAKSAPNTVFVRAATSKLPDGTDGGRVQPDGWILPPHYLVSWDEQRGK